ncbi:MAG: copper amine oxidase N-terminal domain-containing protein [Armatimonadota bacterium]
MNLSTPKKVSCLEKATTRVSPYLILVLTLWFIAVPLYAAVPAPVPETITVVLNGQPIDFYSQHMSERIPARFVKGYAMLPVRFFNEALDIHLDLSLDSWGIIRLGKSYDSMSFNIGKAVAITPVNGFGGDRPMFTVLPLAPCIIQGRLYLPARVVLAFFDYDVEWNAKENVLKIAGPTDRKS